MAIRTHLLTRADIERQFLRPGRTIDTSETDSIEEIGICPVVELLELCELLKKGKLRSSLTSFQSGMQALQEGPVRRGEIVIIALDQERLADSLFERDNHLVIGLWSPGCQPQCISDSLSPAAATASFRSNLGGTVTSMLRQRPFTALWKNWR